MSDPRMKHGPQPPTDKKDKPGGKVKADVLSDGPTLVKPFPEKPDLEGALGIERLDSDPEGLALEETKEVKIPGMAAPSQEPTVVVADQEAVFDENTFEGKLKREGWTYMKPLGEGGMGRVFLARNDDLDELFVVKMMHTHLSQDEGTKERFKHEARAARSVSHENVIKVGIPFKIDGDIFLPMEYVEGETLESRISAGLMDWRQAKGFLMQICDGMQAIHDAGIVHRDIKPENIILQKNNGHGERVKIIDFGLAKKENTKRQYATMDGSVMGSPEYMAPEQAKGKKTDNRTDVYSVGAVFYQLLTGSPPFERDMSKNQNEQWMEVGLRIINEAPVPPIEFGGGRPITKDVNDIVMKCLEKDPAKRYQSMNELKADIEAAAGYEIERAPIIRLTPSLANAAGIDPATIGQHGTPTEPPLQQAVEAPPKEAVEMNPGVFVSKSIIADAAQLKAEGGAEMPAEMTAIVRAPQAPQKGTKTILTTAGAVRQSRKRLNRYLMGGAALIGAGALAGGLYLATARTAPREEPQRESVTAPLVDAGPVRSATAPQDARPVPQPVQINHTLTFNTNVDGVEVLRDGDSACTTANRTCSVELPEGSESVVFTFRRSGFRDQDVTVTPDADRTYTVRMERAQTPRPGGSSRPRPPQGGSNQDDPLLRIQPSYKKSQ